MTSLIFKENPRQIAIRPPKNRGLSSLLIKSEADSSVHASFVPSDALQGFQPLASRPIYGCLGTITVNSESFVGVITEATKAAELEGNYIYAVKSVQFYCISSNRHEKILESSANNINDQVEQHPCTGLIKLLSSGSFYFSNTFDLTKQLRLRKSDASGTYILDNAQFGYVWNRTIITELLRIKNEDVETRNSINESGILVMLMQGYVGIETVSVGNSTWKMAMISRLSSNRAGTRFNARGIDDDGNVSNFVETEFIIYAGQITASFIQLRGSIPLFWEQTGVQVGTHKVKLSRGPESSIHATRKHFQDLIETYSNIQVVNLLHQTQTSPEYPLSEAYRNSVRTLTPEFGQSLKYREFDFAAIIQRDKYERLEELAGPMREVLLEFGFNVFDSSLDVIIQRQYGVPRTNCLDCLDRTNVVQTLFAKLHLQNLLNQLGINLAGFDRDNLENSFNNLWADNGDWLSKIYAGTGALKSSYTRNGKLTMFGLLDDAAKSATRFYVQNFQDKGRQEAIDLLLSTGTYLNTAGSDSIRQELQTHIHEYATFSDLIIYCGTFNLNGRLPQGEDLMSWIYIKSVGLAHIAVIGVQELIKLTPGEYITADTDKLRLMWETALLKCLNSIPSADYVVLRSTHLVALGLFVFIRKDLTSRLRQVEISSIKTGLMGMAANKGGIGIRLRVDDTSLAFVTAHFAAGQSNVEERNRDYWTITNGLHFRGFKLADTDHVFWFGDFNYRIDLENHHVRNKISHSDYGDLWAHDQLSIQIASGNAFKGFQEGSLDFDPTYKYDNGTITYDTSEKSRTPAWTDRVLFKGSDIRILEYGRGNQVMSDHRPVKAMFKVPIALFDQEAKNKIDSSLRQKRGSGGSLAPSSLPPPSTDSVKWWETHQPRDLPTTTGSNPFFDLPQSASATGTLINHHSQPNLMD